MADKEDRPHTAKRKLDLLDQYEPPAAPGMSSDSKKPRLTLPNRTTRPISSLEIDCVGCPLGLTASSSSSESAHGAHKNGEPDTEEPEVADMEDRNGTTAAEGHELAVEVLQRLLEHSALQSRVETLTTEVESLTEARNTAERTCIELSRKYESTFEDLMNSNNDLAQRNKQINVEVGRNEKHLHTITDLRDDLKTKRKEIDRLTDVNHDLHRERRRLEELVNARLPRKHSGKRL